MRIRNLLAAVLAVVAADVALPGSARAAVTPSLGTYRLSGAAALRPVQIWDDGHRTYILWSPEAELPAVFSLSPDGGEVLAEGAMRDGRYVLDRVNSLLIFRIDRSVAKARRRVRR